MHLLDKTFIAKSSFTFAPNWNSRFQSSPSAALEYLEKAVENDERNAFAVLDLLKVYMANISANRSKIDKIFLQAHNHPFYKAEPVRYAEILLLKAVYKFLDGKNDDCVSLMVEACTKSAKCAKSIEVIKPAHILSINISQKNLFICSYRCLNEILIVSTGQTAMALQQTSAKSS